VPIEITCNEYLDGVETLSGVDPPTSTKHAHNAAALEQTPGSMDYGGSSFILMNNEEDQRMRAGRSFGTETKDMRVSAGELIVNGSVIVE
jgi:hypothetical protein